MSLVTCPECGRENVSETAESCPGCGYNIREHFEKIRKQEEGEKILHWRMRNVQMPEKPTRDKQGMKFMAFMDVLSVIFLFIDDPIFSLLGKLGLVLYTVCFFIFYNQHLKAMEKYQQECRLVKENLEAYQKEKVAEEDRRMAKEAMKPRCPHCGSTNIERITTADRVISIGLTGPASGKIGKQYRCKNCKYMW